MTWRDTALTRLVGTGLPIVQAPLAGGPSTPELAAAVSGAGGLGSLGAAYQTPVDIRADIGRVRRLTDRPFAVGLLLPGEPDVRQEDIESVWEQLGPYRRELGLPDSGPPARYSESFADQVSVLVDEAVPVAVFAFGVPEAAVIDALHRRGSRVVITVTSPEEAEVAAGAGADVLSAQGAEAGGHRGSFLPGEGDGHGVAGLVPAVRRVSDVPVVAAGGIMDGRGVAEVLRLGAAGAQLGTAFLCCPEAGTNPAYREALLAGTAPPRVISGISGRPARGLWNRLAEETTAFGGVLPYPVLNALTRDIRRRAAELGRPELLSLWAGTGVAGIRALPAAELVQVLAQETDSVAS